MFIPPDLDADIVSQAISSFNTKKTANLMLNLPDCQIVFVHFSGI